MVKLFQMVNDKKEVFNAVFNIAGPRLGMELVERTLTWLKEAQEVNLFPLDTPIRTVLSNCPHWLPHVQRPASFVLFMLVAIPKTTTEARRVLYARIIDLEAQEIIIPLTTDISLAPMATMVVG